jgi:sister-chromatid-cohesion protein PDS5
LDPDEKVRAAVCRLYSQLEYEVALHHVSESQWRAIAERGLDKKVLVPNTFPEVPPLICAGHGSHGGFELYWKGVQLSIPRIVRDSIRSLSIFLTDLSQREVSDPAAVQHFSWIPGIILSKTPPEVRYDQIVYSLPCLIGIVRSIAEQVLADYVFPFQLSGSKATDINEVAWTERLLHTMKFLDEKSTQHLINLSGLKTA